MTSIDVRVPSEDGAPAYREDLLPDWLPRRNANTDGCIPSHLSSAYSRRVDQTKARLWFGGTALAVFLGVTIQLFVTPNLNVFAYFTIQSNLIVGATSLLLVLNPGRTSTVFEVFRFIGVVAITITGIVFHAALAQLFDLESWSRVANHLVHTVVPVMAVLGWLLYGPRGLTSRRVMWLSVLFPVWYMTFALVRGAIMHRYPYPFADVDALGYVKVLINSVWICGLYLAVAAGAVAIDERLSRNERVSTQAPPPSS